MIATGRAGSPYHRDVGTDSNALHLLRFHLGAGVRVAWRTLVPVAVGVTAASVVAGDARVVLAAIAALFAPPAPSVAAALVLMTVCAGAAAAAAPRLTTGLTGWMRHLPAGGVAQRRAVTAGLALALAPIMIVLLVAVLVTAEQASTVFARLAGMLPLAWAAALAGTRTNRPVARLVAAVAGVAAGVGSWALMPLAVALLVIAEASTGTIASPPLRGRHLGLRAAAALPTGAAWLWLRVTGRALGWRYAGASGAAFPVLVPAALFLRNNHLSPVQEGLAVRLVGVLATVMVLATLVEAVAKRRPPWPWVRTLPWRAGRRAGLDAVLVGAAALPVVLMAAWLSPSALPALLAVVPYLSLRAAAAIRRATGSPSGDLLAEGGLVAAGVALLPWVVLLLLALAPLAARWAAAADQRQPVERWDELQHLATGDSLSWSGP